MRISGGVSSTGFRMKAAIDKKTLHKWVNDKTPGTTDALVLTDATLYYNLVEGECVLVTGVTYGVLSASDSCHFEAGWTTAVAGGGDFTALSPHYEVGTGTVVSGKITSRDEVMPPYHVCYAAGARSISLRVQANDNACVITAGWDGIRIHDHNA